MKPWLPRAFSRHSDSHFNAILIGGVSFVQGKSVEGLVVTLMR
jgi:hypothetical protein